MERIISQLVAFDKEGQRIVEEAREKKREVLAHMSDYKRTLAEQYRQRSDNRVELFRQQARADTDDQLGALHREYEARFEKLRAQFSQQSGEWVRQIVGRCING